MKQLYAIMVWMLLLTGGFSSWAHEVTSDSLILLSDSLESDTLNLDPEWYVAPVIPASLRAPMRAHATTPCREDSVLNFNIDSVLVGITFYTYDESGRTINTTGWSCLPDGSRIGWQKCDYAYSGNYQTLRAIYDWDYELNTWKGVEKEEYVYEGSKMISHTIFDWLDGDWSANMKYTYEYDEAGREIQYIYYSRNLTTLQLEPYRGRFRIWDDNSRMIEDIQYSAHNGTTWSAGTKANLAYDAQGNQIEYTYCSSYSNGNWINSTHENWTYNTSKLKTYYRKQTWSSNKWVTSNEEFYNYNAAGKYLLVEKYALKSGVLAGSSKQTYEYNASNLETSSISYKWSNNAWVNNSWTVTGYDAANNKTETCKYTWKNNKWTGTGSRVLKTFNAKKKVIDQITQTWPTNATNWVNSSRVTADYNAKSFKTQEITYAWQNNNWVGTTRIDWHFNTAGKNDTITTYLMNGTNWIKSTRTLYTYDAKGNTLITKYADWNGSKWVMVSMTRDDYLYAGSALLSKSSWECGEDSIWSGTQKDSTAYSSTGKTIFTAHYTWENGDWTMQNKVETSYDSADRQTIQERFEMVGGLMTGKSRSEKEYDTQGNLLVDASFNNWNSATNTWIGYRKQERAYENGKVTSLTMYNWVSNDWLPNLRFSYSYDAQGNEIMQMSEQYTNGNWTNLSKSEHEYKGDMMVKENTYQWLNNQWMFTSREETYYDNDSEAKLRRHVTGTWEDGVLTSFADFHYVYTCDPAVIRFVNYDGSILETQTLEKGVTPVYNGTTPTRDGEPDNTYTFAGWIPEIVPVTGNATYTATFTTTTNNYTITWLNDDGTQIDQTTLPYGTMPTHDDASKANTAEYTYEFTGWSPGIGIVTGDATYTATFKATKNSYTITWLNSDNSPLNSTTVEYGEAPVYTGEMPSRPNTAEYTYTFAGWTPQIVPVTGDAKYTALFDSIKNSYTITWKNEDGSVIESETLAYGATPAHANINKESTAEWTYTFTGWTPGIGIVTGDAEYIATYDSVRNSYTITWKNEDGTVLQSGEVAYGEAPVYTGEMPSRPNTAENTYTFAGWDKEVVTVTEAATYTATYTATKKTYTITWKNEDGTVLQSGEVAYGEAPVYTGEMPSRPSTAEDTYTFAGWSPEVTTVTGDATYTATYTATERLENKTFTITFYYEEGGIVVDRVVVAYGETPSTNRIPSMPSDERYYYTFSGWSPEIVPANSDADYVATFTAIPIEFRVTFKNYNGRELQSILVPYGEMPEYTGEIPTRPSNKLYTYTFIGWTPEITEVMGNATYTALFETVSRTQDVEEVQSDNVQIEKVLKNGILYIMYNGTKYNLQGQRVQ